jgi:hypothetical protein
VPGIRRASADDIDSVRTSANLKDDIAWDDVDDFVALRRKSNVLFLLESTATMAFSPKGVMPSVVLNREGGEVASAGYGVYDWTEREGEAANWWNTYKIYGLELSDINRMMGQSTHGMGGLPTAWSGGNIPRTERNLYGRDIDAANNFSGHKGTGSDRVDTDMAFYENQYYFPFADASKSEALRSAYSGQTTKLQHRFKDYKNFRFSDIDGQSDLDSDWLGTAVNHDFTYNNLPSGKAFPYALVFKNPAWWETGAPDGATITSDDLVPNDSRMYKTKLVLWRLLQEPNIFQNLRIGLASTYLNPVNMKITMSTNNHSGTADAFDFHGIFSVPPFGSNLYARTIYDGTGPKDEKSSYILTAPTSTNVNTNHTNPTPFTPGTNGHGAGVRYENGIMTEAITGHVRTMTRLHGQYYPVWASQTSELIYGLSVNNMSTTQKNQMKDVYRLQNRGSLHVPVRDYSAEWEKGTKTISQSDKIRMWINGLSDIKSDGLGSDVTTRLTTQDNATRNSQFHYFNDPEIGISGVFSLPSAIFPDKNHSELNHSYLSDNNYIWFSHHSQNRNYNWNVFPSSSEFEQYEFMARARFNKGSGEASGSVIDFFSPPPDTNLADVSYPISNSCEDNWVIVIASGMELKPEPGTYVYHAWDAIKNLYEHTRDNPVSMLKRNSEGKPLNASDVVIPENDTSHRVITTGRLDKPIRTLVIGLVPSVESVADDPVVKREVEEMRLNLTKMARAGQGDDPNDATSPHMPFFADDTETLMRSFEEALTFIELHQEQPSKGAIVESPSMNDIETDESFTYYTSTFRIRRDNQWEGYLTRYAVSEDYDGTITSVTKHWELSDKIKSRRNANAERNLQYWNGTEFTPIKDGSGGLAENFTKLTGLSAGLMETEFMPGKEEAFQSYPPDKAMYDWLNGYDYSYANKDKYNRFSMLADIGQGGVVFVDDPFAGSMLPGYEDWVNGLQYQAPRLYIQTNDGILHVVNPSTGEEERAILPPPVLVPSRMASLKAWPRSNGLLQWIDVTSAESDSSNDVNAKRSEPVYLLDGALQKTRLPISQGASWKTYLLGGLGRGGSGLYMLDVDYHNNPKLAWYMERIDDHVLRMSNQDVPSVVKLADHPYRQYLGKLGFNSPKAAVGITGTATPANMQSIIVLPGGAQNELDLSQNGGEGAVLLILDPMTGDLLNGFDTSSFVTGLGSDNNTGLGSAVPGVAPSMGMMVSEPTLIRSANSAYLTGKIIVSDNRGNIFGIDTEESDEFGNVTPKQISSWNITTIATLQNTLLEAASSSKSYAIQFGVAASKQNDDLWLAGGTSNLKVKRLVDRYPEDGILENDKQFIFAFRTRDGQSCITRDKLKALDPYASQDILEKTDDKQGWHIELLESSPVRGDEYVSAKPLLVGGVLFVATFIPQKIGWETQDLCETSARISGNSRLYVVDISNGRPYWNGKGKYVTLDNAKITGITLSTQGRSMSVKKDDVILITYDKLTDDAVNMDAPDARPLEDLSAFMIYSPQSNGGVNLEDNRNVIQYWIQK